MKKTTKLIALFLVFLTALSCNKSAGTGGSATLKGQVYAYNYSKSFVLSDSGYLGGQKIYIIYGDGTGVSNNTETDNDGRFEFQYLRRGKYQVYVFSKKLHNASLDSTIIQLCEIKTKNEIKELPLFIVNTIK